MEKKSSTSIDGVWVKFAEGKEIKVAFWVGPWADSCVVAVASRVGQIVRTEEFHICTSLP